MVIVLFMKPVTGSFELAFYQKESPWPYFKDISHIGLLLVRSVCLFLSKALPIDEYNANQNDLPYN